MLEVVIRPGKIADVFNVNQLIPEFSEKIDRKFHEVRLKNKTNQLLLVAEVDGRLVGFKIGYQTEDSDVFYSWMGGVIPEFRGKGVAQALADEQEHWARKKGFKYVFFKTRNRFPAMIKLGLNRGFKIVEIIKKGSQDDYRIVMQKTFSDSKD